MSATARRRGNRSGPARTLIAASRELTEALSVIAFAPPVAFVYNPLCYARQSHEEYLGRFGGTRKRVVFLGMNPGPWGMAQTGVPFGDVQTVRDWLCIRAHIAPQGRPEHDIARPGRRRGGVLHCRSARLPSGPCRAGFWYSGDPTVRREERVGALGRNC